MKILGRCLSISFYFLSVPHYEKVNLNVPLWTIRDSDPNEPRCATHLASPRSFGSPLPFFWSPFFIIKSFILRELTENFRVPVLCETDFKSYKDAVGKAYRNFFIKTIFSSHAVSSPVVTVREYAPGLAEQPTSFTSNQTLWSLVEALQRAVMYYCSLWAFFLGWAYFFNPTKSDTLFHQKNKASFVPEQSRIMCQNLFSSAYYSPHEQYFSPSHRPEWCLPSMDCLFVLRIARQQVNNNYPWRSKTALF